MSNMNDWFTCSVCSKVKRTISLACTGHNPNGEDFPVCKSCKKKESEHIVSIAEAAVEYLKGKEK